MQEVFSQILNMSMTGSLVILAVLLVRLLLKKAPKIYAYALWAVVLFRLLCPVSLSAPVSLLNWMRPQVSASSEITSTVSYEPVRYVYSDREAAEELPAPAQIEIRVETEKQEAALELTDIAARIWMAGALLMLIYSIMEYIRLRFTLVGAILYRGEVYLADHISSPFVLGIFRPRVYLPSNTPQKERRYIIAHERHHIRRGDYIIKLLAYFALCVHWFNPLAWMAFTLAGKDMEMSCDEAVIKKLGSHIRADYSASLLRLATGRRIIAGTPLAFGEGDTKGRVMNMARWKKPKLWVSILCVILCVAVLAACAVNPTQTEPTEALQEGTWDGKFKFDLPEGYEFDRDENGNMIFTDGTNIIGGKLDFPMPDVEYDPYYWWLHDLPIWENQQEGLATMGGSSLYGDWQISYGSDVPPGEPITVDRMHYFYITENTVYDIWFDRLLVDHGVEDAILESVIIGSTTDFPPAAFSEENINILLTVFPEDAENAVADSTVLLSVAPDFSKVTMGSILKDTYVSLPDYRGHITGDNRFSACYALGKVWGGREGAEEMVNQCIRNNFGIEVDHNLELTDLDGLMDILRDFTGELNAPLDDNLQLISQQLLTMIARSDHPTEWEKAREALASAKWEECTIPAEGSYTAKEMDIGGTVQNVLVMNEESEEQEGDMTVNYMPTRPPVPGNTVTTEIEFYNNSFTSTDGTVEFNIMAPLPEEFTDVSVFEAEPHYLTEADVHRAAQAIFGEEAYFTEKVPLLSQYNETEEQLRSAIDRMAPYTSVEAWEELAGTEPIYGESCEERAQTTALLLEEYQSKLDNFRNDYPEEPCLFAWRNSSYYINGYAQEDVCDSIEAYVEMDGISYEFTASTWNTDKFKLNNIYVMPQWHAGYSELDERILYRDHCRDNPSALQIATAAEKTAKMLEKMDLGQWEIDETYVEVIKYHHPDHPEYVIHVNAVPIIEGVAELRREQHSNINTASEDKPEDNYYLTQAEFEFAPDGVLLQATIYSPMEVEKVSQTNMVHNTEGLMDIAEEILMGNNIDGYGLNVTEMGYQDVKCIVNITEIRSGMARQRLHGTDATYQYFPALSFYGTVTYEFADGNKIDRDGEVWNLLTLNALYGSVITNFGE